jgi:hypothetical protein
MVPLVPKLAVTTPGATLPVPMAPIMLSPPPALTTTSGESVARGELRAQRAGGFVRAGQRRQPVGEFLVDRVDRLTRTTCASAHP